MLSGNYTDEYVCKSGINRKRIDLVTASGLSCTLSVHCK